MASPTGRHRVYLSFQDRHGWQCQALEADLKTPLPNLAKIRVKRADHGWEITGGDLLGPYGFRYLRAGLQCANNHRVRWRGRTRLETDGPVRPTPWSRTNKLQSPSALLGAA